MRRLWFFASLCFFCLAFPLTTVAGPVLAKDQTDFVFSLSEPQWKEEGPKFYACETCDVRLVSITNGAGVIVHDQVANSLMTVSPNYLESKEKPSFVVIGIFSPMGWEKDIHSKGFLHGREAQAQHDLGLEYSVTASSAPGPSGYEGVLFTIIKTPRTTK